MGKEQQWRSRRRRRNVLASDGCLAHATRSITPNTLQPIARLLWHISKKEEISVGVLFAGQREENLLLIAQSI
jgi:hypothetical protein